MSAPLALFDLDGTLLDGRHRRALVRVPDRAPACSIATASPTLNADIAARYARARHQRRQEFCDFYASTLAGRSAEAWEPLRGRFVAASIEPRLGAQARALVARHRERGDVLVLTTATNRFLAEPIAASLGMDHLIATELEAEAAVFTGRNSGVLNMRDGKVSGCATGSPSAGADERVLADAFFYSDSINDVALLRAVGRPVAVDPDERLDAVARDAGWPIVRLARWDAPLSGRR